jgi:hypothetical protein
MKILYVLFLIMLLSFTNLSAQGFAWNQAVTAGDTMVWANATVKVYYQFHPYCNSTGTSDVTSVPIVASRFWSGSNNTTKRDSLGLVTAALCDSTARIFVITNQTNYTWGGWLRFYITDGTNSKYSNPVRIGNKQGALTVFYYLDDVGTSKLNLWFLVQGL